MIFLFQSGFCNFKTDFNKSGKKIAVIWLEEFPTAETENYSLEEIKSALTGYDYEILSTPDDIKTKLHISNYHSLILANGSCFPGDFWNQIYSFITAGGKIMNLGGAPFTIPVFINYDNDKKLVYKVGERQVSFAQKLMIGPPDKINIPDKKFKLITLNDFVTDINNFPVPDFVYELNVRFSWNRDFNDEDGTSGTRDAVIRSLVQVTNEDNIPIAAPIVEIDRLKGYDAGARWIFVNMNKKISSEIIKLLVERLFTTATEFRAYPVKASLEKYEKPEIKILLRRPKDKNLDSIKIFVQIFNSENKAIFKDHFYLKGERDFIIQNFTFNKFKKLSPGFYKVKCELINPKFKPDKCETAFWIRDERLLTSAKKLTVSKDWIRKDGKVFPIIGTTYMASDVHRKFLFEPNPYLWDKDMKMMKDFGINFIRTGIWTGWKRIMIEDGAIDENFLRALDAFILTAAKNNIYVCFTLFAFSPPMYGGINPYLDNRALEGQKTFINLITKRYRDINWVHFDLINEPSYAPPDQLWQNRPIYDEYEKSYWYEWLKLNHNNNFNSLIDKWKIPEVDISLPRTDELGYRMIREYRNPRKAFDFNYFTNEVITRWADTLAKIIRINTNNKLVTLGQDEGGTFIRPSQQFHYKSIDYTCVHPWWNNDDLLWDGLASKVPEKPMLVQETGLMRLENIDGWNWQTPDEAAKMLDKKFGYSFAARGCGSVEWVWNINPYQPIDNESVIGIFRPDGTAKPEINVFRKFSEFFKSTENYLDDYYDSEVILLIPHTKLFLGRPAAFDGIKKLVHILSENFGICPLLISDINLKADRVKNSSLIIYPSPEFIYDSTIVELKKLLSQGKKLFISGAIEGNQYGIITNEFKEFLNTSNTNLEYGEKFLTPKGDETFVTFGSLMKEKIRKSKTERANRFINNIWFEPLPIDYVNEKESIINLFSSVFNECNIKYQISKLPVVFQTLENENYILIVIINETNEKVNYTFDLLNKKFEVELKGNNTHLFIVDKKSKTIIAEKN